MILKARVVVEYKFRKPRSSQNHLWDLNGGLESTPIRINLPQNMQLPSAFIYIRNSILSEAVIYLTRDVCEFSADDYCSGCHCRSNCVVAASGVIVLTKHMFMGSLPIHYLDCSESDS